MGSVNKNNLFLSSLALTGGAFGLYKGFQIGKEIANREISETSFFGAGLTGVRSIIKYSFTLVGGLTGGSIGALAAVSATKLTTIAISYFSKK